jgi:uncharacterized protein
VTRVNCPAFIHFARRAPAAAGVALFVAALLSGCASMRSYQFEMNRAIDLVEVGQVEAALEAHDTNNRRGRKQLLYWLERGELLRLAGRYEESQQAWMQADAHVQQWENAARARPDRLLRDAASLLLSDRARAYEGADFEKVMLTARMALNHIALGEWDLARVAVRRTHEREAVIARLREVQVARAEEEAQKRGQSRSFRELDGYPVQTIDSPEVNALRNSYQSAFSHYLAGFLYEALGEPSLAAAGYRQAIELQPGIPLLEQSLAGLDARVFDRDPGRAELLVVIERGSAPARASAQVNLPVFTDAGMLLVPVSMPVIRNTGFVAPVDKVSIEGVAAASVPTITSVDLMARRQLRDEMPWIMLRSVSRATAKGILQHQAMRRDDTGLAGALAVIGTVLTEQADERGWRTLPAEISVARVNVGRGVQRMRIESGARTHEFDVNVDDRYALVSVRMLGNRAYLAAPPASQGEHAQRPKSLVVGADAAFR